MKPIRIQRSRQHKQISPNGLEIVYCGRPSKFGNPYNGGNYMELLGELTRAGLTIPNSKLTDDNFNNFLVEAFEHYLFENTELIAIVKKELKGKNLSCWCKVGEPCHVDILLKIANE